MGREDDIEQTPAFSTVETGGQADDETGCGKCFAVILTILSVLLIAVTFPISIWMVVQKVQVRIVLLGS